MTQEQDRIKLNEWLITKGIPEKVRKIICKRAKNPEVIMYGHYLDYSSSSFRWDQTPEGREFWASANDKLRGCCAKGIHYPDHIIDLSELYPTLPFDEYFFDGVTNRVLNFSGQIISEDSGSITLTDADGYPREFVVQAIKIGANHHNNHQQTQSTKTPDVVGYVVSWTNSGITESDSGLDDCEVYHSLDAIKEESECSEAAEGIIYQLVPIGRVTTKRTTEIQKF